MIDGDAYVCLLEDMVSQKYINCHIRDYSPSKDQHQSQISYDISPRIKRYIWNHIVKT